MPEILDQAIYFRPENPEELCAAMTEIVFDSDVRKKIISKVNAEHQCLLGTEQQHRQQTFIAKYWYNHVHPRIF